MSFLDPTGGVRLKKRGRHLRRRSMPTKRSELCRAGDLAWVPAAGAPPGVQGGVSTRLGGVSRGHLESLNLGGRAGDAEGYVATNLGRLAAATGVALDRAARIRLVHGTRMVEARGPGLIGDADGLWTQSMGLPLALTVADCLPLLLATARGPVALVHCGWRGLAAGIAGEAVGALCAAARIAPASLWAWIGPGIGPCCFQVDERVATRFPATAVQQPSPGGGWHVDLIAFLKESLVAAGLVADQVWAAGRCTACEPELFYSHRRDHGTTGRMLAWVERHA
jgi:polyphenol oxidase